MTLRRRKMDERGALEGLPLYLIILVVIAGIGIAILAGWMMGSRTADLDYIELYRTTMTTSEKKIEVTAYDQRGNTLEGVFITINGCGINEAGETNDKGVYSISQSPVLGGGQTHGTIEVTATYTGSMRVTKTAHINVVP